METLDWNKMLICTAKCKERTLPVQEGRPLHHTIIKYSASFYFSNSLTTLVYLFLTLAPFMEMVIFFSQSRVFFALKHEIRYVVFTLQQVKMLSNNEEHVVLSLF